MKRLFFIGCLTMMAVLFLPISVSADGCSSCHFDIGSEPDNITGLDADTDGVVAVASQATDINDQKDSKSQNEPYLWQNLSFEPEQYLSVKCYNCLRYDKHVSKVK